MERVSILMDGEYNTEEAVQAFARLKSEVPMRDAWDAYHLIGDAMRGSPGVSPGFCTRLSERLAQEPTVLAPRVSTAPRKVQTYALRAAASVAAVAVVGWASMNILTNDAPVGPLMTVLTVPPKLAELQPAPFAAPPQKDALPAAPEQFNEYLLAHQGVSPTTAIQGVTPYVRTVSATGE